MAGPWDALGEGIARGVEAYQRNKQRRSEEEQFKALQALREREASLNAAREKREKRQFDIMYGGSPEVPAQEPITIPGLGVGANYGVIPGKAAVTATKGLAVQQAELALKTGQKSLEENPYETVTVYDVPVLTHRSDGTRKTQGEITAEARDILQDRYKQELNIWAVRNKEKPPEKLELYTDNKFDTLKANAAIANATGFDPFTWQDDIRALDEKTRNEVLNRAIRSISATYSFNDPNLQAKIRKDLTDYIQSRHELGFKTNEQVILEKKQADELAGKTPWTGIAGPMPEGKEKDPGTGKLRKKQLSAPEQVKEIGGGFAEQGKKFVKGVTESGKALWSAATGKTDLDYYEQQTGRDGVTRWYRKGTRNQVTDPDLIKKLNALLLQKKR